MATKYMCIIWNQVFQFFQNILVCRVWKNNLFNKMIQLKIVFNQNS